MLSAVNAWQDPNRGVVAGTVPQDSSTTNRAAPAIVIGILFSIFSHRPFILHVRLSLAHCMRPPTIRFI